MKTVAVAGLGLIGGSIAKAVRARTDHAVIGFDRAPEVVQSALEEGTVTVGIDGDGIDEAGEAHFTRADLILVALYPGDAVAFLEKHAASFRPGAVVVDLCGVKRFVCEAARPLFASPERATFIGGHPMAGRECSGFSNATAELFSGASMILTPFSDTPSGIIQETGDFFRSLGFGHIEVTTPERHDEMIAYTSQLAHVVSSAYVQSPEARDYRGFSAGSFKDLTRVAKLNEKMWTELFLLNRDYLSSQLGVIIENLSLFREYIDRGETDRLQEMLRIGSELKQKL